MNASQQAGQGATLLDLLKVLGRRPLLLTASAVGGALVGLVVAMQTPGTYEAIAMVRMGTVTQTANITDVRDTREALQLRLVETPAQAAERVKLPAFVAESKLAGGAPEDLVKRVSVRLVRETDLMEMRYRAPGREEAERGLRALFETLRRRHEELAQPGKARLADQLRVVQQLRSESTGRRGELLQSLRGAPLGSIRGEYPFLQLAFAGQDSELLRWEVSLQAALAPPMTAPTSLMEAISVSDKPVNPARVLVVIGGLLAGVLFAAAVILFQFLSRRRAAGG